MCCIVHAFLLQRKNNKNHNHISIMHISALRLTFNPSAHTQSSGQPFFAVVVSSLGSHLICGIKGGREQKSNPC